MAELVLGNGRDSKFDKQMNVYKPPTAGACCRCGLNVPRPTPQDHYHILLVFWHHNHQGKQETVRNKII